MAICAKNKDWRAAGQVFLAGAAAAVSLLPYLSVLFSGRDVSIVLRTGVTPSKLLEKFGEAMGFPYGQFLYVWGLLALLTIAAAAVDWRQSGKAAAAAGAWIELDDLCLFAGVTVPVAVVAYCLFLWQAALSVQAWYLLPLMALVAVCFDLSLSPRHNYFRATLVLFAVITVLISISIIHFQTQYRFTNMDLRVRQLSAHASPDDYVIVLPWFCGISFEHYYTNAIHWTTIPPVADHATHRYDLVKAGLEDTNAIAPVFQQINATLQSGHRVWILASAGWMDIPDPKVLPPASLPPPPLAGSGWSEFPYTMVWASQIKHSLVDRSLEFVCIRNPTADLRVAEQMELFMISGWKTNAP
jgi:hypothetical protein